MELDYAIKNRRSIRIYKPEPVSDELLKEVIKAGTYAPSASNKQLWYFIVVDDNNIKEKLFNLGATHILLSPQSIFVLYGDPDPNWKYPDDVESASACVQNMLLKAYELSLGTCWVNHLPEQHTLKKLLKIPDYFKIIGQINIGYIKKEPKFVERKKTLYEIISYNFFNCDYIMKPKKKQNIRNYLAKIIRKYKRKKREKSKMFGWNNLKRPLQGWPGLKDNKFEEMEDNNE